MGIVSSFIVSSRVGDGIFLALKKQY